MKHAWVALIAIGFAGCITPGPAERAKAGGHHEMSYEAVYKPAKPSLSAAQRAALCKVTLTEAIATALAKVEGQAMGAIVEIEKGKAIYEVTIVAQGKVWEVEVDAATGAVLEVEQEDDDDDDDDDDGDDDDD